MKKLIMPALFAALALSSPICSRASDVSEDVKQAAKDTKKSVRKGVRSAKDKTCELVDGKMNCAAKKLKHKVQNVGDDIKN